MTWKRRGDGERWSIAEDWVDNGLRKRRKLRTAQKIAAQHLNCFTGYMRFDTAEF